jgi:outer membrane immunogenic protein
MRRFLLAVAMCGGVTSAQAADLPDLPILRGSFTDGLTTSRAYWEGLYIGGQAGYGSSDENFDSKPSSLIASLISDNVVQQMGVAQWNLGLGKQSARSSAYGAFVGSFHDVGVTSASSISISDMATFRGRAAYAFGCFLPYAFGGFALGKANISHTAIVTDAVGPSALGPFTQLMPLSATDAVHNHLIYGYTAGLGIDINLVGGLFMRAEWEYIRFTTTVDTSINTVRAGLGYKF